MDIITETVLVDEVIAVTLLLNLSTLETIPVNEDTPTVLAVSFVTLSDDALVDEVVTLDALAFITGTDVISVDETLLVTILLVLSVEDTLSLDDPPILVLLALPNVTDDTVADEAVTLATLAFPAGVDDLTLDEAVTLGLLTFASLSEAVTSDESVTVFVPVLAPTVVEGLALVETVLVIPMLVFTTTDLVGLTETVSREPLSPWLAAAARAATLAQSSGAYDPILLVNFLDLGRLFGTGAVPTLPVELFLARLEEGGVGAITVDLDETTESLVRLSNATFRLRNEENLLSSLGAQLPNARVLISLGFVGLPSASFLPLFTGTVDKYEADYGAITISAVDLRLQHGQNLSVSIDRLFFSQARGASRQAFIPIPFGVVKNAPTILLNATAPTSTLRFPLLQADTVLYLREVDAAFPTRGVLTIGTESGITYSGLQVTEVLGVTCLQLQQVAHTRPQDHLAAETVTLMHPTFEYLIGYQIDRLNAVYNSAGAVIAATSYTLETLAADHLVSLVQSPTSLGTITVDINGPLGDTSPVIANGDFETGVITPWTVVSGATATIASLAPLPAEGNYRLELRGTLNTFREVYQDVTVIPGLQYDWSLFWQDSSHPVAVINGDFETGVLSPWSIIFNDGNRGTLTVMAPTFGAAHERFALQARFAGESVFNAASQYDVIFVQDLTTIVGMTYQVDFSYITLSSSGGGETVYSDVGFLIVNDPFLGNAFTYVGNRPTDPEFASTWLHGAFLFTAQATTTRLEFNMLGYGFTGGFLNLRRIESYVDFVVVALFGVNEALDHTDSALRLGTQAQPDLYLDDVLSASVGAWTKTSGTFSPGVTPIRVTLRSRYGLQPRSSFFDSVFIPKRTADIIQHGLNPADVIQYLLATFVPGAVLDAVSFAEAHTRLVGWEFSGLLSNPGDSTVLAQRLAAQCGVLLQQDALGVYTLTVLDSARLSVWTFDQSNIVGNITLATEGQDPGAVIPTASTFHAPQRPMDALYTEFYVYFGTKTGGSTSSSDFTGIAWVTPTDTNSDITPGLLIAQCKSALGLRGGANRLDVFADAIQDWHTANLLLQWTVKRHTEAQTLPTFHTWLDALPLRIGQVVTIVHPTLPDAGNTVQAELVGWHFDPATMTLEVVTRTMRTPALTILPLPPLARDDVFKTAINMPATVDVAHNDQASPGATLDLASIDLTPDVPGQQTTLTLTGQGTFDALGGGLVRLTPATDFEGRIVTPYTIGDNLGSVSRRAYLTAHVTDILWRNVLQAPRLGAANVTILCGVCSIGNGRVLAYRNVNTATQAALIYRSADNGATWTQVATIPHTSGSSGVTGRLLAVTTDTVVMHEGGVGFWRTIDGGDTWTLIPFVGGQSWAVAHQPGGRLFFGGAYPAAAPDAGVVWSDDQGVTWGNRTKVEGSWTFVRALAHLTGDTLLAGGFYSAGAGTTKLAISTNNGVTWALQSTGLPGPIGTIGFPSRILYDILQLPTGVVLACGYARDQANTEPPWIWRSTDGGTTWVRIDPTTVIGYVVSNFYQCSSFLSLGGDVVLVALRGVTRLDDPMFRLSVDGGATWPIRTLFDVGSDHGGFGGAAYQMALADDGSVSAAIYENTGTFQIWHGERL